MKFLKAWFLSLVIVWSSSAPYMAKAQSYQTANQLLLSPVDMFSSQLDPNRLYLESPQGRVINHYQVLGFTGPIPDIAVDEFRTSLNTRNFLLDFPADELTRNIQYQNLLNTPEGRQTLTRYYRGAFTALAIVSNADLVSSTSEKRTAVRSELIRQGAFQSETNLQYRSSLINLETLRQTLADFPEDLRRSAQAQISDSQRALSSATRRARFNFTHGLTPGQEPPRRASYNPLNYIRRAAGNVVIRVQDPFGRDVDISWPKSADGEEIPNRRDFFRQIKSGTIEAGKMSMFILAFLYISSEVNMIRQFEMNPRAFEDRLDQVMSWAMPLSLGSFFVGGAAADKAFESLNMSRRAKANLMTLVQNRSLMANRPDLRANFIRANMASIKSASFISRATSYTGLGAGFLISQLVYQYANQMESCNRLEFANQGYYTSIEIDRLTQSCEQGWLGLTQAVATSPETWMAFTALLSTKYIFALGMNRLQMSRYAYSTNLNATQALSAAEHGGKFNYKLAIRSRGLLAAPFVTGVVGFVVFYLIFEGVMYGMKWVAGRIQNNLPAKEAAQNIRDLMASYKSNGWDMTKLCDDRHLFQGGLIEFLRPLAFWIDDTERCGEQLVKEFLDHHSDSNSKWRKKIYGPVEAAIMKWQEYTFKAVNLQNSAYLLYKDIAEQIKAQKNSGRIVRFNRVDNPSSFTKDALGYVNTHLYNHPLPLFRSEPYFGFDYKLKQDSNEIFVRGYDGQTTTWSERYQNRTGVEEFNQRLERFKTTVVPKVVLALENRLNAPRVDSYEKQVIERILGYLKFKNRNGVSEISKISKGLDLIAQHIETSPGTVCDITEVCFWSEFQKEFFDGSLWAADENDIYHFRGQSNYFAGYKTNSINPYGIKPIGPGQGFFIRYDSRLKNNGIDTSYYEPTYDSLTDYLLKQMVCGVDVMNGEKMKEQTTFGWIMSSVSGGYFDQHREPEFRAPKIQLKGTVNPCFDQYPNNRWQRTLTPYASNGFYNYIEDKNNPNLNYGGIVEFLYKEAGDQFVENFDQWWTTYVEPEFTDVVDRVYKQYFQEQLIDGVLAETIQIDNNDNNCYENCNGFVFEHKNGLAAAVKQEMDTHFTYFLNEIINDFGLDLRFTKNQDQQAARQYLINSVAAVRKDLYDIFNFVSGRTTALSTPELQGLYRLVLEEVAAQNLVENPTSNQVSNSDVLKFRALKVLIVNQMMRFKVLTKTVYFDPTEGSMPWQILQRSQTLLNSNLDLSEEEKSIQEQIVLENFLELEASVLNGTNRDGKVLLQYTDYPNDVDPSPTQVVIDHSQNRIIQILEELISYQEVKYLLGSR